MKLNSQTYTYTYTDFFNDVDYLAKLVTGMSLMEIHNMRIHQEPTEPIEQTFYKDVDMLCRLSLNKSLKEVHEFRKRSEARSSGCTKRGF